jgi:tetratricopeptide (TPR) repeat protein
LRHADTGTSTHFLHEFRRLWETKRYQELLAKSQSELGRLTNDAESGNLQAQTTLASLYSLVGSAKQAMGDAEGAKDAYREAVHWAPVHDRPTPQQQLASLAAIVGRRFLQQAERTREEEEMERIQALRQATLWLREGVSVRSDDAELLSGLERARRGLLAAYGRVATAMIERQEFHGARRLLREALSEEQIPVERREVFLDLIASTFAGEIGILAADAVRALEAGQENEAVVLFQRAEKVLSSVPEDAISSERRYEINRRFWWGYTKLGIRRLQNGRADAAVDPLLRAVKIPGIDPDRQQQTRQALVDACHDLLEHRTQAMQDLISQGRTADAQLEGDRLRGILEDGIRYGIQPEEFGSEFDRFKDLMLRLGLPVG